MLGRFSHGRINLVNESKLTEHLSFGSGSGRKCSPEDERRRIPPEHNQPISGAALLSLHYLIHQTQRDELIGP